MQKDFSMIKPNKYFNLYRLINLTLKTFARFTDNTVYWFKSNLLDRRFLKEVDK